MPSDEQRLGGVCAATLTPLDAALEPDHAALIAHCRRLLDNGCDAINLLGTTGEASSLSRAERVGVMEAVAGAGLPVERFMVGTGAAAFDDAVVLTRAAVELGFAGALVMPPFYFKNLTDDGVFVFYERLVKRVGDRRLRLYLYHFPQLTGFVFSPALVARLSAAFPKTLVGIKDSSGTPGYAQTLAAACPRLDIFPSSEAGLAETRASGFAGCISATLNVSAPLAQRVWNGDRGLQRALGVIRAAIAQHQLVPAVRAVVASLLGDGRWLRVASPLLPLPELAAARLVAELDMIPEFSAIRDAFACV